MWCWRQAQIRPHEDPYEVVVSFVGAEMVWAGWFTFATIPIKVYLVTSTGWCEYSQRYIRYGGLMWCWRQAEFDLLRTHTRLWCRPYAIWRSEPVDLPLLLSQTKYNCSLAPVHEIVDRARYDMVAKCGVGSQPKSDLLSTHTRL